MIGCDPIVAANKATLAVMREGRTFVALNTHGDADRGVRQRPRLAVPGRQLRGARSPRRPGRDARRRRSTPTQLAVQLLGDSIYTNPLMLGYAWQQGRVPLSHAALMRAIELNGVQVENNKAAFEWGRRAAHDLAGGARRWSAAGAGDRVRQAAVNVDELIAKRVEFLTAYQNAAYAARYQRACVEQGARAPRRARLQPAEHQLTEAVARYLFKLMAYKDEYEVARLHTDTELPRQDRGAVRGRLGLQLALPPRAAADREEERQGRAVRSSSSGRGC